MKLTSVLARRIGFYSEIENDGICRDRDLSLRDVLKNGVPKITIIL